MEEALTLTLILTLMCPWAEYRAGVDEQVEKVKSVSCSVVSDSETHEL